MALQKNTKEIKVEEIKFDNHIDAQLVFKDKSKTQEQRSEALEFLIKNKSVAHMLQLVNLMFTDNEVDDHLYIDMVFNSFHNVPKTDEDYSNFTKSLQSDNVYLRNMAIKYLQESNEEATIFIDRLLRSDDKDIRIFAINILGDVQYDKSIDMLRYFMAQEDDVNAMMTAVDYMGEIGSVEDIALLETLKIAHKDDPYVLFGVDTAIERIRG
ncbi:MAG: HEAT repeat domain-containing protein [Campylobacterota bacterium]|nr:HEAT repeat domain-containing protein [Campylobacterota bacterium]